MPSRRHSEPLIVLLTVAFTVSLTAASNASVSLADASGSAVPTQTYTAPPTALQPVVERDTPTIIDTRLDGIAAADRMLSWTTYRSGYCMEAVWTAFGSPTPDVPGGYYYARNGWERTPEPNRHYDRLPPKGSIVYFQNTANPSAPGHIAISLGDGNVISTDKPGTGMVGVSSISAIETSWGGRTYLGWTDYFMGNFVKTQE